MRYIVIGGSGFVGQELIRQLKEKGENNIIVLDIVSPRSEVEYVKQDITEEITFEFKPGDVVVQLAANQYHHKVPRKGRQEFFENVNCRGTENILKKMRADGASEMVFFSTDMVYGKPQYLPVDAGHPQQPFGYYGASKKKAEDICRKFRDRGMNITIFRPRMIIGKGRLGILIKLFKLIEWNLPVPMIGSGKNCYQMVSVNDCADAVLKAVDHNFPNAEYNLGSKNPPQVKVLLQGIIKQNRSKSVLLPTWGSFVKAVLGIFGKVGVEIMYKEQYMIADEDYIIDISQTEKELGWHPQYNDADMMQAAFIEYQNHQRKEDKND